MLTLGQSGFFSASSGMKAVFLNYCKLTQKLPVCLKRGYFWPISMHLSTDWNILQAFEKTKENKKSKPTCQDGPFNA